MYMYTIGIVGLGFVGTAVKVSYATTPEVNVICVDSDPSKMCFHTFEDLDKTDAIFICVPSPQSADGSCSVAPLLEVLDKLKNYKNLIISKVTAPPSVYEELQVSFPNLVHAPEFLTAANAREDYLSSKFAILGGSVKAYLNEAEKIIKIGQSSLEQIRMCSIGEAALSKYIINSFLATKVVFMNEMENLARAGGQDWRTVRNLIQLDPRIGKSHTMVPGPDGHYGFGGACFPKDTSALLQYAQSLDCSLSVLDSAVKKNTLLRLTDSSK